MKPGNEPERFTDAGDLCAPLSPEQAAAWARGDYTLTPLEAYYCLTYVPEYESGHASIFSDELRVKLERIAREPIMEAQADGILAFTLSPNFAE